MINYTERISLLMEDIVARVPTLSFIDMSRVLVFARAGRTDAEGAYATCHCVCLPASEPGYYFWRDRGTGKLTRRSEWFVTKSPQVRIGTQQIDYMISFALPRFCDQMLSRSRKQVHYQGQPNWIAKLDTIVHELYHIDPERPGHPPHGARRRHVLGQLPRPALLRGRRGDGATSTSRASRTRETYDFLQHNFDELTARFGGMVGTTFRGFPSYPQRYTEVLSPQPDVAARGRLPRRAAEDAARRRRSFTEDDLVMREFLPNTSRQLVRKGKFCAA